MVVASSFAPCEWESRSWRVSTTVVRMGPSHGEVGVGKMAPRTLAVGRRLVRSGGKGKKGRGKMGGEKTYLDGGGDYVRFGGW